MGPGAGQFHLDLMGLSLVAAGDGGETGLILVAGRSVDLGGDQERPDVVGRGQQGSAIIEEI